MGMGQWNQYTMQNTDIQDDTTIRILGILYLFFYKYEKKKKKKKKKSVLCVFIYGWHWLYVLYSTVSSSGSDGAGGGRWEGFTAEDGAELFGDRCGRHVRDTEEDMDPQRECEADGGTRGCD